MNKDLPLLFLTVESARQWRYANNAGGVVVSLYQPRTDHTARLYPPHIAPAQIARVMKAASERGRLIQNS